MCTLFQTNDFSLLVVNMHVSSKNLSDRRTQSIEIVNDCVKELNKEYEKALKVNTQLSSEEEEFKEISKIPILMVITGDLNARTGKNIIDRLTD